MCGICGVLNSDSSPADAAPIAGMIARLRHRGPDDCGVFIDANVGLGHSRLSIIDLTGGHQPMPNRNGRLLVYATQTPDSVGEIFAH